MLTEQADGDCRLLGSIGDVSFPDARNEQGGAENSMKIAFVGLGNMGLPMALNLVKAGHEVYGVNRSPGKEEAFAATGGRIGRGIAELAGEVDALLTCLPLPADAELVYLGDRGVIASGRKDMLLIDCSTSSPKAVSRIAAASAAAGMAFVDAPVSGGTVGAEQGTLSIMVGGDRQAYERALPLLETLGSHIYHVGGIGSGTVVKLLNQWMVGIHTMAASEAMVLADRLGVTKEKLHEILSRSFAQSRIYDRHYAQFVAFESFRPGFALNLLLKDLTLAEQMAAGSGASLPVGSQAKNAIGAAAAAGYGDQDMSAMYAYLTNRHAEPKPRKHFVVLLPMKDEDKSRIFRPQHLSFLERQRKLGRLFANGRFTDGWGGLVIYIAEDEHEVQGWVQEDPYIFEGARSYEIHEWDLVRGQLY